MKSKYMNFVTKYKIPNLAKLEIYTSTFWGNIWRSTSEYSSVSLLDLSRVALSLNAQIAFPSSLPLSDKEDIKMKICLDKHYNFTE